MDLLKRIVEAVVMFVVAWLVFWLVATLLVAIPTEPTVWLGEVLHRVEVILAALVAVIYFVSGKRVL